VLPLVPSYLAYVGGSAAGGAAARGPRRLALRNSLLFILGFSLVFIALGASASLLGSLLFRYRELAVRLGGVLIVLFGLLLLGVLKLPAFQREARLRFAGDSSTPWGAVLLGMAFAAGWTPCIGPVLGGILTLAASSGTLTQGTLLLMSYALGLGLPFFLSALALERFLKLSGALRRHLVWVERVAGALLVAAGLLMLSGRYTALNQQLLRFTPEWLFSKL
jgi:cytochrome c-type biogenesis protein